MPAEWESPEMWRKYVERTLYELGTLVRGQIPVQAERIADVVEQLNEIRQELAALTTRVDKASEFMKAHVKKENGS